jgi:16S rRNA (guanine527-N7)-methyltransferase
MLDPTRIAALLRPFADVSDELANRLRIYLDLLLRWNARINLTAIRDPEHIVTRHFGESLFAARILCDAGAFKSGSGGAPTLSDIGSGAGFPGVPIKLVAPEVHVTLIESQNKKATFLRQVIRTLDLKGIDVFSDRAEAWNHTAQAVTFRAVEKFEQTLSLAATLVAPSGTLCLLIGKKQVESAEAALAPRWQFREAIATPTSRERMLLVGTRAQILEI